MANKHAKQKQIMIKEITVSDLREKVFNDDRLSFSSIGLILLMTSISGYEEVGKCFKAEELTSFSNDDIHSISRSLDELKKYKYLFGVSGGFYLNFIILS